MLLRDNSHLLKAYRAADYVVVDSQIVFWALRFLGSPVPEKISGSDFLPAYCTHHACPEGKRIFILGGKPGVAQMAREKINQRCGMNVVIGAHSPSMKFGLDEQENQHVIDLINQSGATAIAVGLGAPKQEIWIDQHRHAFNIDMSFLAVGAAIDFEAGTQPRAPQWMSKAGLEWAYRLSREPGRLWQRYLVRDTKFLWMVVKEKLLMALRTRGNTMK
jgi:N-acetylglucosaminyldiphosphoundecaprenol N-acetyl-beta-D-mannosaminyltransferase